MIPVAKKYIDKFKEMMGKIGYETASTIELENVGENLFFIHCRIYKYIKELYKKEYNKLKLEIEKLKDLPDWDSDWIYLNSSTITVSKKVFFHININIYSYLLDGKTYETITIKVYYPFEEKISNTHIKKLLNEINRLLLKK